MRTFYTLFVLLLLLISIFPNAQSGTLSASERAKLAPQFQSILAKAFPSSGFQEAAVMREPARVLAEGTPVYDAIVYTSSADAIRATGVSVNSVYPGFVTAQLSPDDMLKIAARAEVRYLDPGSVNTPQIDVSTWEIGAQLVQSGFVNGIPYKGAGAIVLIYDTGIDWKHLDFRNPGDTTKSRILAIWDQTLSPISGESNPSGFTYGVEYTQAMINDELDGSPTGIVRERDIHGHGTHVASTAAGNGRSLAKRYIGVAPEADLVIVKGGDGSFSESRMIDGLTYAAMVGTRFGKPVSTNWSIGTSSGPHDGSYAYETAIDAFTTGAGHVHSNSAGNSGATAMHIGGNIASGDSVSIMFTVPAYTPLSGANNDNFTFEFYLRGTESCRATVVSPTGVTYTRVANSFGTGPDDTDGSIYIENGLLVNNDNRYVIMEISDVNSARPPKNGTWTLRVAGLSGAQAFDGWLSDNTVGSTSVTLVGGNTSKTVSSPGNSAGAITVASYVTKWGWPTYFGSAYVFNNSIDGTGGISSFSSIGPTADGRLKPDIAAPGQGITAALSQWSSAFTTSDTTRILPGKRHWLIEGTSMASPHVCGTAALLLGIQPSLTASQIKGLINTTGNADALTGSLPNFVWGNGKLDVVEAVARKIAPASTIDRTVLAYDVINPTTNVVFALTGTAKLAVRFTPTFSGKVTGAQINITTPSNRPIVGAGPMRCEIWTNTTGSVEGIPGTKIGNTVLAPFDQLTPITSNTVDMQGANVSVLVGQQYHLVISVTNATDTLKVRGDNGTTAPTNRSSIFNGSAWLNIADGSSGFANSNLRMRVMVTGANGINAVEELDVIPEEYTLNQNYPNPFNPTTAISYQLPAVSKTRLVVYDLLGREVAVLVNESQTAGRHEARFDGRNLSSGVYFYRLEANGFVQTKKMTLVK
jgi:minor extracellular serine protease Vpr